MLSLLALCRSARAAGACWFAPASLWFGARSVARRGGPRLRLFMRSAGHLAFCFGLGGMRRADAWAGVVGGRSGMRADGVWWVVVAVGGCSPILPPAPALRPAPVLALPRCPCGRVLGSAFCRCGRAFSAVLPRAVGAGAGVVVGASSRRAPAGLVALCAFPVWSAAAVFARACPGLFGVVPPFVRRAGPAWVVSVPVSSLR